MSVFSTDHKSKLSKDLSYPIGITRIQESLGDIPQAEHISVNFFDELASHVYDVVASQQTIPVLEAKYRYMDYGLGAHDNTWWLSIYSVPRQKKHCIQQALISEGLSIIQEWLSCPRPKIWYQSTQECEVLFNLKVEKLEWKERTR